ncbi:MAG: MBL fold metallo-hydrolase [Caldilineaceae bacterium]|nr:MBL fold metallo-hydrolase [Caldilineaceae bacterium]
MKLTFHGAAQEVTGSMHLLEVNDQRILLDCGLFQGRRAETYERNLRFPFDPKSIDAVVISHAHIDHTGKLPNLVKQGFNGNIWSTAATRNLSSYMLLDSGHIQESDIEYLNKRRKRRGEPPVEPIYTQADARDTLPLFVSVGTDRPVPVADGVKLTYYNAGHILGSAFVLLEIREFSTGKEWRLVFSGDLGREELAILRPPDTLTDADILIMESTYGNRLHGSYLDARERLKEVVSATAKRRGKVIIPAFAVGRTQELVYALNVLDEAGDIPELPVFVDSPLAVNATDVFRMHPESWNQEVQEFLTEGKRRNPFDSSHIEYVRDVRRSKQLNFITDPAIIISASGMVESGRILHHVKNNITHKENTILFVSFQAEHTLGRRILEGADEVKIYGDEYPVRARIECINGYSAHADQGELLEWASHFDKQRLQKTFLVHGEKEAAFTLADKLETQGHRAVEVPRLGQTVEF